jgi:hypothetical protein
VLKALFRCVVLSLALAGCNSAQEGDTCKVGEGGCDSDTTMLICDRGDTLRRFHCRGTGGCTVTKGVSICDSGTFQAGDACPLSFEGQGQCDPANANQVLTCNNGTMQAQTCNGCTQSGKNCIRGVGLLP